MDRPRMIKRILLFTAAYLLGLLTPAIVRFMRDPVTMLLGATLIGEPGREETARVTSPLSRRAPGVRRSSVER